MFTKLFVFIFVFSILFLIKEIILFIRVLMSGEKNMTEKRLWGIGLSIAYIITMLFTGFKF